MGQGESPSAPEDYRGDALRNLRFGQRVAIEALGGMVVHVDEAGGEDQALRVNDLFAGCGLEEADFGDFVSGDAHTYFF